jgi:hypothetical protein
VRLTARRRTRRGFPGGDRFIREPHGQTAPLPQRLIIRCPIRDASLRLRNVVRRSALYLCGMKARSERPEQPPPYAIPLIRATRYRTLEQAA